MGCGLICYVRFLLVMNWFKGFFFVCIKLIEIFVDYIKWWLLCNGLEDKVEVDGFNWVILL